MGEGVLHNYQAFGLNIASELTLPELLKTGQLASNESNKVYIHETILDPAHFESGLFENGFRFENHQLFMLIDEVGYFQVADENTIYFQRDPRQEINVVQDRDIRVFLLGSCLGAILLLRGYLPLHASIAIIGADTVGFVGHSGAGKSSTLAMLSEQGHSVLTDDVAAINFDEPNAMVFPAYPQMKINTDIAEVLHIPQSSLQWINRFRSKYSKRCDHHFSTEAHSLNAIFRLKTEPGLTEAIVKPLYGAEKFEAISQNAYRQFFHAHFDIRQRVAQQVLEVCQQCEVYDLYRPAALSKDSLEKTKEAIYLTVGFR